MSLQQQQERQGFRFGLGCTMGSMCITLSLLLVFQLSHRCWAVADDLSSYINQKEDQVREIADEIGRLNARKCDAELVAQCSSSCSRHSCSPIGELDNSDMYKLGCQETQKNPFCSASGDHSVDCNHHRVNYAMSYIRLPPNMSTSGVIPLEMCSSICMTKHLEEIFYKFGEFSKDDAFYFGSIDGTQRMYPGQEQNHSTCFNFDPRKRTWYNGAISVEKHLAVLIDHTSFSDSFGVDSQYLESALEASKRIVRELIYTVSPFDILDVIAFSETDAYEVSQSPVIVGGEMSTNIDMVRDYVNMIQATKGNPTQFTNGFLDGIKLALKPDQNKPYLRVILLFTNGVFASFLQNEKIEEVSRMLQNGSAKLLIYSFKETRNLETLANKTGGFYEYIYKNFQNPLYQIRSYFNFMANARKSSNDTPYWTDYYATSGEFGAVITVSYQAVSSEGQLIGVAAIDITSAVLEDLVTVVHDKLNIRPQNLNASLDPSVIRPNTDQNCSSCDGSKINTDQNCSSCDGSKIICPKNSSLTFAELICCDKCNPKSHHHKTWNTKIILLVSVLLAVLLLLIAALVSYRCQRRRRTNYAIRSIALTSNGPGIYG